MRSSLRHLDGHLSPRHRWLGRDVPDLDAIRALVRRSMREWNGAPLLDQMAPFGFNAIGSGIDKMVYLHPTWRWVVKVPTARWGWEHHLAEREFYNRFSPYERRFLPTTYWLDRFTAIQRRMDTDYKRFQRISRDIGFIARHLGIGDHHEGNVGFDGDDWAFIDFAPRMSVGSAPDALERAKAATQAARERYTSNRIWVRRAA